MKIERIVFYKRNALSEVYIPAFVTEIQGIAFIKS